MTMAYDELKPCPFCEGGSPPEMQKEEMGWRVICTWCAAKVGYVAGKPSIAADLWNERTIEDVLLKKLRVVNGELTEATVANGERMSLLAELVNVLHLTFTGANDDTIQRAAKKALSQYEGWLQGRQKDGSDW